jgi:hypothetical protein
MLYAVLMLCRPLRHCSAVPCYAKPAHKTTVLCRAMPCYAMMEARAMPCYAMCTACYTALFSYYNADKIWIRSKMDGERLTALGMQFQ